MDAKKAIKQYIHGSKLSRWGSRALFAGSFLGLIMAFVTLDMDTWMTLCFICLLFGLCTALPSMLTNRNMKRSLRALEEAGRLGHAANELEAPNNIIIGKDKLRLTQNYIFSRNGVAVQYTDLVWCFKRVQRVNFIPVGSSLVVYTPTMPELVLMVAPGSDKKDKLMEVLERIYQRNPRMMLGFSMENSKAYKAIQKAAKNK